MIKLKINKRNDGWNGKNSSKLYQQIRRQQSKMNALIQMRKNVKTVKTVSKTEKEDMGKGYRVGKEYGYGMEKPSNKERYEVIRNLKQQKVVKPHGIYNYMVRNSGKEMRKWVNSE